MDFALERTNNSMLGLTSWVIALCTDSGSKEMVCAHFSTADSDNVISIQFTLVLREVCCLNEYNVMHNTAVYIFVGLACVVDRCRARFSCRRGHWPVWPRVLLPRKGVLSMGVWCGCLGSRVVTIGWLRWRHWKVETATWEGTEIAVSNHRRPNRCSFAGN